MFEEELEPVEEEVVDEEFEDKFDDELVPVRDEEEKRYVSVERFKSIPRRGYENLPTFQELIYYVSNKLMGYVSKVGKTWYLSAAPGHDFLEIVFESNEPRMNSYIRITDHYTARKPIRRGSTIYRKDIIVVRDWEYTKPPKNKVKPPMSFKEFCDLVIEGIEFETRVFEKLFPYSFVGAPFIISSKRAEKFIGGSRVVVYGDQSSELTNFLKDIMKYMPKPIEYVSDLYRSIKARDYKKLEKIGSKDSKVLTLFNRPAEVVGIVKRVDIPYYNVYYSLLYKDKYDYYRIVDMVLYEKLVNPIMVLKDPSGYLFDIAKDLLEYLDTLHITPSIGKMLDLRPEALPGAILRLATSIARAKNSEEITTEHLLIARNTYLSSIDEILSNITHIGGIISPPLLYRDVVSYVKYYGEPVKIGDKNKICIKKKELIRKLMKRYGISEAEAEDKIRKAMHYTKEILQPSIDLVCLID